MFLATVGLLIVYLHPSVGGGLPDHSHTLFGCGLYNISARLSVCLDFEGLRGKKKHLNQEKLRVEPERVTHFHFLASRR